MLGYFTVNGKSSKDFKVYLTDASAYGIAERDVEVVSVKGKNGDLTLDNGRYKNKKFEYPAIIIDNFKVNYNALINYLSAQKGYVRLEDSFYPEIFVLARYVGDNDPKKTSNEGTKGTFKLAFDRKPQRFLKSGEQPIEITSSITLLNEYPQTANPLIRAYGTGTFTIGGVSVQITSADGYTDIDCDLEEAYKDTLATNCNDNIVLTSGEFPSLVSGDNAISMDGITKLVIYPRWWIL